MANNNALLRKFYTAFQSMDHVTMNSCYTEDIVFSDPVFGLLKGEAVRAMWEMLCTNAKDFSLDYSNIIQLDEEYSTCDWVAKYTFTKTGRRVVNKIRANMRIAEGKVIEHSDAFSVHQWSKQAIGFSGLLFGWSSFFQRKIRNQANRNLLKFMQGKA